MIGKIEIQLNKKWLPYSLIALLGLIVYSNSFTIPFILDDFGSIVNNYSIRDPLNLTAIWNFYSNRFVIYVTFAINYFIHNNGVEGYHITNLAIHIFNGILFFIILQYILGLKYFEDKVPGRYRNIISLVSAMIFISHPLQVNAVSYIVQRTASLAGTFYLLAILFFIKYRLTDKIRHYVLIMLFTVLAMFTKENAITIPFMLAILEFMFFLGDEKTLWKKRLVFLFIIFLTVPIIPGTNLFLKGYSQSDPDVSFKASTSMDRFQYFYTEMNVMLTYIKLLFIPDRQNFDYSNNFPFSHTIWENQAYISFIILFVIGSAGLFNARRNKLVSLGILWFFITLSVESTFISIKDVYFEHRLYLPVAGFIICLVGIIFNESWRFKGLYTIKKPMLYFLVASAVIITMNSALTLKRNYVYSDGVRLWSDVVEKAPKSDRAHGVLGGNYLDKYSLKDPKTRIYLYDAEKELKEAIKLNYNNDTAHCNLSKVYLLMKQYDKCIDEARRTNAIGQSTYAYYNMGMAYKEQGKTTEALENFKEGYNLDNKCSFILDALASAYYDLKDYKKARFFYEEYLKNSKFNTKWVQGRIDEINKKLNT